MYVIKNLNLKIYILRKSVVVVVVVVLVMTVPSAELYTSVLFIPSTYTKPQKNYQISVSRTARSMNEFCKGFLEVFLDLMKR